MEKSALSSALSHHIYRIRQFIRHKVKQNLYKFQLHLHPFIIVPETTMEKNQKLILLLLTTGWMFNIDSWAFSIHDPTTIFISRKNFLSSVLTAAGAATTTTVLSPSAVLALDMDAFMEKELQKDTPKQMSDDERMCKFGAPGTERGEACKRAGMSVNAGGSKVDAFGNIDRGNFVRCSTSYPMINGQYVKTVTCM